MTEQDKTSASHPTAEFDAFAPGYAAGMENPLKAMMGDSAEQYVDVKLRWLLRQFPSLRTATAATRVLDYGCGTATLLRLMAQARIQASLTGCDVSPEMLSEGERCWPAHLQVRPLLHLQHRARTGFPDHAFDFVIISAVLHHVSPHERGEVYAELVRITRPNGTIVVFEHNPLNPVTRYVVARTPIDRGAILLRASQVVAGLTEAGAGRPRTHYIMFAPPRLRALQPIEAALGWLPLGAQYAVSATV